MNFLKFNPIERIFLWNLEIAFKIFLFVLSIFLIIDKVYFLGILLLMVSILGFKNLGAKKDLWHQKGDPEEFLDFAAKKVIIKSLNEAEFLKTIDLEILIFKNSIKNKRIVKILKRLDLDNKEFYSFISNLKLEEFKEEIKNSFKKILLQKLESILNKALIDSFDLKFHYIPLEIIFLNCISPEILKELQIKWQVGLNDIKSAFVVEFLSKKIIITQKQINIVRKPKKKKFVNRALTSRPTPFLDSISEDLTFLAELGQIGFLIGHKENLDLLISVIEKNANNNAILIGEIGSGKTTILYHLAWLIKNDQVPKNLQDKRLILIKANLLFEDEKTILQKINKIIFEANRAKNIILALQDHPNNHLIIENFKDLIESSTPLIVLATPENYTKLSKIPYVVDSFTPIKVKPLTEEEAIYLLSLESVLWEKKFNILIKTKAISTAVSLANKFLRPKILPNSARELILETINRTKAKIIDENMIAETLSLILNFPVTLPEKDETQILLNLENIIHQYLIDQDEAVNEIAESLRAYRVGLKKTKGPIGVFLFVGPTGVGKTELSKILAKIYFNNILVRFDMGQFQTLSEAEKLIGSENQTGVLTDTIRQKPFCVLLLDEFEKCHQKIWDLFLAIFDEGKIQDFMGREVDFSNSIIIATSNAHSNLIYKLIKEGKSYKEISEIVREKLVEIFPPELLNRFDSIIIFKPLKKEDIAKIVDLKIKELNEKLLKIGYEITLKDNAKERIIEEGYNETFGARALNRVIQENIYDQLSIKILKGEFEKGKKIIVEFQGNWIFYQNK
jgi:ATP-dependent Clp protease ATP-binding subunit ClpC